MYIWTWCIYRPTVNWGYLYCHFNYIHIVILVITLPRMGKNNKAGMHA